MVDIRIYSSLLINVCVFNFIKRKKKMFRLVNKFIFNCLLNIRDIFNIKWLRKVINIRLGKDILGKCR